MEVREVKTLKFFLRRPEPRMLQLLNLTASSKVTISLNYFEMQIGNIHPLLKAIFEQESFRPFRYNFSINSTNHRELPEKGTHPTLISLKDNHRAKRFASTVTASAAPQIQVNEQTHPLSLPPISSPLVYLCVCVAVLTLTQIMNTKCSASQPPRVFGQKCQLWEVGM